MRRGNVLSALNFVCLIAGVFFIYGCASGPGANPGSAPDLKVAPFRTLGTGKADSTADGINPPDGLAFTKDGLLAVTDAANRTVKIFNPADGRLCALCGGPPSWGEIVNVIVLPDGSLLASDEKNNQAYLIKRGPGAPPVLALQEEPLFKNDGFKRLNGLAADAKGRIYVVDGVAGEVRRYLPDFKPDPSWKFQTVRANGTKIIARSEGITVHEKSGTLFVTDEWAGVIHAYELETGRWTGKTIGRRLNPENGAPLGPSLFNPSVEGIAVMGDWLLAVDEEDEKNPGDNFGRLLFFDLRDPAVYDGGGLAGWLGPYKSPDGVAVFSGRPGLRPMVALANQGAFLVPLYYWDDILAAINKTREAGARTSADKNQQR
jgi:sugar lactone lactonase YvrE